MDETKLDFDVEQFNPENSERINRAKGLTGPALKAVLGIEAMIYKRPKEEIRAALRKRRAEGK